MTTAIKSPDARLAAEQTDLRLDCLDRVLIPRGIKISHSPMVGLLSLSIALLGSNISAQSPDRKGLTWAPTETPINVVKFLYGHQTTWLENGMVLLSGGALGPTGLATNAQLYDSASGSWSLTGSLVTPREDHTATRLADGRVLITGGQGGIFPGPGRLAEVYDPSTGIWVQTGSMAESRVFHEAVLLQSGRVLVAGGGGFSNPLSTVEIWDPAKNSWRFTGSMRLGREGFQLVLLNDGRALAIGGRNQDHDLAKVEVYDPDRGSWLITGNLATPRSEFSAALLPDGRVLVAGGFHNGAQAGAEIYDPATGVWTTVASMNAPRVGARAVSLAGRVLVTGGQYSPHIADTWEMYDPATDTWTMGKLNTVCVQHSMTLLRDHSILITGGGGNSDPICELGTVLR